MCIFFFKKKVYFFTFHYKIWVIYVDHAAFNKFCYSRKVILNHISLWQVVMILWFNNYVRDRKNRSSKWQTSKIGLMWCTCHLLSIPWSHFPCGRTTFRRSTAYIIPKHRWGASDSSYRVCTKKKNPHSFVKAPLYESVILYVAWFEELLYPAWCGTSLRFVC